MVQFVEEAADTRSQAPVLDIRYSSAEARLWGVPTWPGRPLNPALRGL